MLLYWQLRESCPVGLYPLPPLQLVDRLEVGQATTGGEVGCAVAGRARRAAREGDDAIHPEQRGQPDRIAQVGVVPARDRLVGMQRIAPDVQRRHPEASR